jgi:hypothetical protein
MSITQMTVACQPVVAPLADALLALPGYVQE